jgi:uncharacterized protein YqhQ
MMLFSANVQARGRADMEVPNRVVALMLGFSLTFVIGLFFVVPLLVTRASSQFVSNGLGNNAIEGAIRLGIFLGYLWLVGRLGTMQRVFQYHGAEHKTINAFEHGDSLDPTTVQRYSTTHVRCGTAFILWVLVISVVVFALIGHPPLLLGILSRVVLVPLIAAISYEILRLGARFYGFAPVRLILQPGLWLQGLTTREPSDDQVAVAIAALQGVLSADRALDQRGQPSNDGLPRVSTAGSG